MTTISAGTHPGFDNAPVTKGLLLCVGGCSLVAYFLECRHLTHLQLIPNLTTEYEFWRLITSQCITTTSGDYFFGSLVMYQLRVIERQFGSSKYAAFFLVTSALSTIFEIGALAVGRKYGLTSIPAGPYGFIFAALYQFYKIIPPSSHYTFLGINISNKASVYFLTALPFIAFQSPSSLVAAMCGILAGVIYRSNLLNIKEWRLPQFINRFASRFILPILSTTPRRRSPAIVLDQRAQPVQDRARNPSSTSSVTRQPIINEEYVDNLRSMFPQRSQETITRALLLSDNDINRAAQFLLDHP
ncbi:12240_t:CDS:2 [Cetraspora pellucida]|uniref:12240_t:CDS:1 n=1 Tax=Cetraspora pellucida TaxID=1433469 RepID=A0A9N9CJ50_9GLOM|nr:12240_t:CDS:2 [Cetraspora pellucida]